MTIAQLAAALARVFEGLRLAAYWDPTGKVWTIAFGHTKGVTEGMTCTAEQAEQWLAEDFAPLLAAVEGLPLIEAAALVSFGLNCGYTAMERVLRYEIRVTDGHFVTDDGQHYGEVSGGVRLAGLVARRNLEARLIEAARV